MTDETQLRLQIQQQIDREAKIDRLIECKIKKKKKKKKKKIKNKRQFKRVYRRDDCDAVLIFYRDNLSYFNFVLNGEEEPFVMNDPNAADKIVVIYLKNKNTHDSKQHTYSSIKKSA